LAVDLEAGGSGMEVSYKKLWKLLIDKDMKKKELVAKAGVSDTVIAKLGKGQNVTVETLAKICVTLDCEITDIMEIIPDRTVRKDK
jgi:DNA-binding Xre family transcriptional regulator